MSVNFVFWGARKLFFTSENDILIPNQIFLSDINKTYIDIGNGQKFQPCTLEYKICQNWVKFDPRNSSCFCDYILIKSHL